MSEDSRRVADYFAVCGIPSPGHQQPLEEGSVEVNLKPSHNQDPITDITVIFPGLGENVPDYYQLLDESPGGYPADLNHGSFRAPEVFICYRRGRDRPPLVELGILSDNRDKISPGTQLVEFTPNGHIANVNNSNNASTFLTYRRADEVNPCNEFVVMDIEIIIASKGEMPSHTFIKIDKSLNKGMVGSDVFLCYKKTMNRADYICYKPELLDRFPVTDSSSYPLNPVVALFCLPLGATLECWRTGAASTNITKSSFVLNVHNAGKVYGSSISFYEEYDENLVTEEQAKLLRLSQYANKEDRRIMASKCICLLSQWPFFDAFEKFLFFIYKRLLMGPFDIPLERFISHFLYHVPFPSPERPRILVQLSSSSPAQGQIQDIISLYQPQELPLPRSGANFRLLVTTLGPDNCLLLLLLALTEQKIFVHSLRPDVVTAVCEALMQIIFPFYWQCPYIPLCPIGMCDYLHAPLPFVMGLDSRFFDQHDQPGDVVPVDLDTNTISLASNFSHLSSRLLPKRAARTLKNRLIALQEKSLQHNKYAQRLEMENDDTIDFEFKLRARENALELEIQETFLVFMASVLGGYRQFLLPITRAPTAGVTDVDNLFDTQAFLRSRDRNYHQFYNMMMKTQMFTKFVEECSFVSDINTSLAFFDECVERVEREEGGRLLESEVSLSDRTVFILPPEPTGLPPGAEYRNSTLTKFDHSLFQASPWAGDEVSSDQLATPASSLAKRTKQEIRSAVKMARKHVDNPLLWAKCLLGSCYSIWFLHLPSMVLQGQGATATIRTGHSLLERMQRLRLHPVDEICYRVMMQLCGVYRQPVLAVKLLFEMRRHGVHPNAVTYGYYNKAVLESEWPHGIASGSQLLWHKLRNVLTAVWLFKQAGRQRRQKEEADNLSLESGLSQSGISTNEALESADVQQQEEAEGQEGKQEGSDVGYGSLNETETERVRTLSIVRPPVDMDTEETEPELRSKSATARTLFGEETGGVRKSESCESLEVLESLPDSPEKTRRLPTLVEAEISTESPERAQLEKVPVTLNDPLGALSSQTSPTSTPARQASNGEMLSQRSMSMSDVLGEPFSTPVSSKTAVQMARSSTMPLNSDGENSPQGSTTPSMFGSISSLAGSGMKSLTSSKAAGLGLRRGKALLSSAWTSLSPQTSKNTKEALHSLRSGLSSAATNLSKKYEEMTAPTHLPGGLTEPEEDRVSQSSTESRRQSETVAVDGVAQDTWSTLTEALWNHLWGDNARSQPSSNVTQRAADITEQFETLYARANLETEERPVAVRVEMTTCSRCRVCGSVIYDEEIMAGWTAEDSNLNTCCPFCQRLTVPSLVILLTDYRSSPPAGDLSHPLQTLPPVTQPPISVPYISPLVLRKELETVLDKEGDTCLTNPSLPQLHPIIYWNLIYFFHRIAVPSHLPGLLLGSAVAGWDNLDYRNVRVVTRWDNEELHEREMMPLHIQWRRRNCATDPRVMHPLMHTVIKGVKENDLKYCVESIIRERVRKEGGQVTEATNTNSIYRETLFLTLVSLGQDNIDLTAFDREYRRAFEKLRIKDLNSTVACDKPPAMGVLFCRKLFRELRV